MYPGYLLDTLIFILTLTLTLSVTLILPLILTLILTFILTLTLTLTLILTPLHPHCYVRKRSVVNVYVHACVLLGDTDNHCPNKRWCSALPGVYIKPCFQHQRGSVPAYV